MQCSNNKGFFKQDRISTIMQMQSTGTMRW